MKQNVSQINSGIMINVNVNVKNIINVKKKYVWNPATCSCENRKYLASIMDDSVITCDDVIEPYNKEINLNEKKAICKTKNFYVLPASY